MFYNVGKTWEKARDNQWYKNRENVFALTFKGLSHRDTNEEILNLLSDSKSEIHIFVTGIDAMENSEFIKNLI